MRDTDSYKLYGASSSSSDRFESIELLGLEREREKWTISFTLTLLCWRNRNFVFDPIRSFEFWSFSAQCTHLQEFASKRQLHYFRRFYLFTTSSSVNQCWQGFERNVFDRFCETYGGHKIQVLYIHYRKKKTLQRFLRTWESSAFVYKTCDIN